MILPTKGIRSDKALLSVGASVLRALTEPKTVSRLWSEISAQNEHEFQISFDWFVLALDLLFAIGAVEYESGRIERARTSTEALS